MSTVKLANPEPSAIISNGRNPETFPPLADVPAVRPDQLPSVCLVTGELVGLFRNGGLGTSMTGLIELLAAYGASVTVIYTADPGAINRSDIKMRYAAAGITLEFLDELVAPTVLGPMSEFAWTAAYRVYAALKSRQYDVIHFNDTIGEAIYCVVAKRFGLAFDGTLLCLALHSPTQWILALNRHPASWLGFDYFIEGERVSIEATDLLWGPSKYLLNWIQAEGYRLPQQIYQQQYIIPTANLFAPGRSKCEEAAKPPCPRSRRAPKEVIFFGRLEERKGIRLFCAALSVLGSYLEQRGVSVTFMGKPSSVGGQPADLFVESRGADWRFNWRIESSLGQHEAIAYLTNRDCFAVMASPFDNSPCTVYEALQFGIPFIAARTGGIPELIASEDHAKHLFEYRVSDLANRILDVLENGIDLARPAISVAENQARWLRMHLEWTKYLPVPLQSSSKARRIRRYGILIDHSKDADALKRTQDSLQKAFGSQLVALAVIRRELAPIEGVAEGAIVASELVDLEAADILAHFDGAEANVIFAIRSGLRVNAQAGRLIDQSLMANVDGVTLTAVVGTPAGVIPALGGSIPISLLAGGTHGLGIALDRRALDAIPLQTLSTAHTFLGLRDEALIQGLKVWPLPEPVIQADELERTFNENSEIETRIRRFSRAPREDVYRMLALGHHVYKQLYSPPILGTAVAVAAERLASSRYKAIAFRVFGEDRIRRAVARLRRMLTRLSK